jgi:hypothetical protein
MRTCGRCGDTKANTEFNWRFRDRGLRDNYCRLCRSAYKKAHYAANKSRYVANATKRKAALADTNTVQLLAFLRDRACVDCGITDPLVLEFDHLRDKAFTIGHAMALKRWEVILPEIAKCDVVCANCHRRRTLLRGGFRRTRV